MIWFSLIIPVAVFLFVLFAYSKKLHPGGMALMLAIPVVIVLICKYTCESIQTRDIEFWGGWAKTAEYNEDWNEYIHRTCTRSYPCGSDSKGNTRYCSETYDCSYVQYHPAYWQINGSNAEEIGVSQGKFEELAKRWNSRQFVNMHHPYYTKNGNRYLTTWNNDRATVETITTKHTWTNRVKASKSVFNFEKVDPTKLGLFEIPALNGYQQRVILGDSSTTTIKADTDLMYYNATLGAKRRLRCYILVFKDKPIQAGVDQQAYWKGGKKNEFVVTIGIDKDQNVQWSYVFSWSDAEQLKIDTKVEIMSMSKLDLNYLVEFLGQQLGKRFIKKNFHDFDYLSVDPPGWVIGLTFALTGIASIIAAVCSVVYEIGEGL